MKKEVIAVPAKLDTPCKKTAWSVKVYQINLVPLINCFTKVFVCISLHIAEKRTTFPCCLFHGVRAEYEIEMTSGLKDWCFF